MSVRERRFITTNSVQNDATVRDDAAVPTNGVAVQPVRRHRCGAADVAAGTVCRPSSHRRRRRIISHRCATPLWCMTAFLFLYVRPLLSLLPFRYSVLIPTVLPYPYTRTHTRLCFCDYSVEPYIVHCDCTAVSCFGTISHSQ